MKKNYKIVKSNSLNADQHLIGFYETAEEANEFKMKQLHKKSNIAYRDLLVKRVDPELIFAPVCTDYMHYVRSLIPNEEWARVMASDAAAELCTDDLMCGGATYYYLARMIPRNWSVIDIGASYGAQSYLFAKHKRYIAVEPYPTDSEHFHIESFKAKGTERYEMTAGKFLSEILPTLNLNPEKTFAICNYVPSWFGENPAELTRQHFQNVFVFYPNCER